MLKEMILLSVVVFILFSCNILKKTPNADITSKSSPVKSDTTQKTTTNQLKPYREIITAKAVTDKGLFTVHKVDDKYYFEIPDSLLNRDIMVVSRISKSASFKRVMSMAGELGLGGDLIGENVLRFSKGGNNQILLQKQLFWERAKDSSDGGMYQSLQNSNFAAIANLFDIKALTPDSSAFIIDMTDFLNSEHDLFFFSYWVKQTGLKLGTYQKDKSYINEVLSYPLNVEIRTIKTYLGGADQWGELATFELNTSMVLLPALPLKPRLNDDRVGYFSQGYSEFEADGVQPKYVITRWRLEPKEEDMERYRKGELVEPQKPIIYYIDPATPAKWVPYLIQGVNDWKEAFEKAGFKNAIYALKAPVNDPDWSMNDARHNVIVYKASHWANASGPHIHDPRTGEILETHINWYHSVMKLLRDWYMVQAAAIDPRARKKEFDDSLMGQLIRFVCAHEVGHTLGLTHNFGASSVVPVDSLRSKRWVEANGHTPSIMDYARFNYVAQPEDSVGERGIMPRIGAYDKWAIEWGYRLLPDFKTEKEEKEYVNDWIINRVEQDKRLWYGGNGRGENDWRCQMEDLGDNSMKASYYGIQNLKRILPQLVEWTKKTDGDYNDLSDVQKIVVQQFHQYLLHVVTHVGSWIGFEKISRQTDTEYKFTSREQQKEAVQFLHEQLFTTPKWLMNKKIFSLVGGNGHQYLNKIQMDILGRLLSLGNFSVLLYFEENHPNTAYTISEFLNDVESGIWSELKQNRPIDMYRRNLQKSYVAQLSQLSASVTSIGLPGNNNILSTRRSSDISSVVKAHARQLVVAVNKAISFYKDDLTRYHLQDIKESLQGILNIQLVQPVPIATQGRGFSLGIDNHSLKTEKIVCDMFGKDMQK